MTISETSEVSDLSERQWKRIKKGVREHGDAFVIHKNRGKKPQNAIADDVKEQVIELKNSFKYDEANFRHFQELLEENESLRLSKPTVYKNRSGMVGALEVYPAVGFRWSNRPARPHQHLDFAQHDRVTRVLEGKGAPSIR